MGIMMKVTMKYLFDESIRVVDASIIIGGSGVCWKSCMRWLKYICAVLQENATECELVVFGH